MSVDDNPRPSPIPPLHERTFTDIGSECFTDGYVISYKGENYYKACDYFVSNLDDGGQSFCVKRVDHPGMYHEDYEGRLKLRAEAEGLPAQRDTITMIWPRMVPDGSPITKAGLRSAFKDILTPMQEGASLYGEMAEELRTLLAAMRHIYAAMPMDEEAEE